MFTVQLMPKAIKDLEAMPKTDGKRMYDRLLALETCLTGDIKKLTHFSPTYRLRSGDWRPCSTSPRPRSSSIASSIGAMPTAEFTMTLHPQIIEKEGKREFVVLPYDEHLQIQEALEDLHDLQTLQEARQQHAGVKGTPLREAGKNLGFDP